MKINKETIEVLPILNHEETDSSLIFLAGVSNEVAIIVAKHADVFLLVICGLGQLECYPIGIWRMILNIRWVTTILVSEISDVVPGLHAIIG